MRVIFLDIDGVLNSNDWFEKRKNIDKLLLVDGVHPYYQHDLDPEAVARLRTLIMDTNAKIVLSSVWRLLDERLDAISKCVADIMDITPRCTSGVRGAEIEMWIQKNVPYIERDTFQYAIIDDDSDMLLWQKDNFFQTSFMHGLTDEICQNIRKHFE